MAEEGVGNASDVPWASVFDPAVNVRALGEIQARGFRAATELVDKFVRMADRMAGDSARDISDADHPVSEKDSSTTASGASPDLEKLIGTWQGMVGQWAGSVSAGATPAPERATVDLVSAEAAGQVVLTANQPGAVSGEVWLHNGGGVDLGKVRLRCSHLMSHDGTVVSDELIRFEPDSVPMPARCSRGVTIQIDVADDVPAGRYRGTLLADGYADVWLPLTLVISSAVQ
ncbi:hypothetical protein BH10ACT9_BH10ACT9_46370 [soil metagenome]